MTTPTPDPEADRYAYTHAALARLVLSYEMRDLAKRAMSEVPTGSDGYAEPGEHVGSALDLVEQAQKALTAAVLYERTKGTSWEAIADQLDVRKQSAHERYRDAEQQWRAALHEPRLTHPDGQFSTLVLHYAAYQPTEVGQDLDKWAEELGFDEHSVTGNLPHLSLLEELNQVLDGLNYLYRDMSTVPEPAARARLLDRKAALLDRMAVEEGRPDAVLQAAEARALAAQLRTEAEGGA
jgi:hypothetical protein